jgi:hypothetical protein
VGQANRVAFHTVKYFACVAQCDNLGQMAKVYWAVPSVAYELHLKSMQATTSVQKRYLACKHKRRQTYTPNVWALEKGKSGFVVENGSEEGSGRRRGCILPAV